MTSSVDVFRSSSSIYIEATVKQPLFPNLRELTHIQQNVVFCLQSFAVVRVNAICWY